MTTYLISRHPGAIEWAARQHMPVDQRMAHLDPAIVQAGDVVIGSLPVNLAAQVCARGAVLAHASLQRHDYLRAAVFMFEAVSTKAVWDQKMGDTNNFDNRKEAYKNLSENNAKAKDLEFLRNALAHGVRPAGLPEREVLKDRQTLAAALRRMADDLLTP